MYCKNFLYEIKSFFLWKTCEFYLKEMKSCKPEVSTKPGKKRKKENHNFSANKSTGKSLKVGVHKRNQSSFFPIIHRKGNTQIPQRKISDRTSKYRNFSFENPVLCLHFSTDFKQMWKKCGKPGMPVDYCPVISLRSSLISKLKSVLSIHLRCIFSHDVIMVAWSRLNIFAILG